MKKFISACSIICLIMPMIAGCATPPEKISASYVSPLTYQDFSCRQIRGEISRVSRKVHEVSGVQQKEASKDTAAMGVGLIIFWPALFFLIGSDKKEELARLKGEYEALEQAAIKKNCDIAAEIKEARELEEKRLEEKKQSGQRDTKDFN